MSAIIGKEVFSHMCFYLHSLAGRMATRVRSQDWSRLPPRLFKTEAEAEVYENILGALICGPFCTYGALHVDIEDAKTVYGWLDPGRFTCSLKGLVLRDMEAAPGRVHLGMNESEYLFTTIGLFSHQRSGIEAMRSANGSKMGSYYLFSLQRRPNYDVIEPASVPIELPPPWPGQSFVALETESGKSVRKTWRQYIKRELQRSFDLAAKYNGPFSKRQTEVLGMCIFLLDTLPAEARREEK
jgi:hypothetical protein